MPVFSEDTGCFIFSNFHLKIQHACAAEGCMTVLQNQSEVLAADQPSGPK